MTYPRHTEIRSSENEIVYTLDLAGNFMFVNAAAERVTGYSCEEARRMNVSDVVAPESAGYVWQQIMRTIKEGLGAVFEIEIITKDRRRVALETSTHLVVRDGCPVEIHGIALPPFRTRQVVRFLRSQCVDEQFVFGTWSRSRQR